MAIGPMDIHHKEFSTVRVGGYNKEEVDSFLDLVADELDRLLHRNQEQAELIESMREKVNQFDSMQQTLQNALINAQKSADNIVQEAKLQAEAQIREAQEQSLRILEEAKAERARLLQAYSGLREQIRAYLATIGEMLERNQALVREYEARISAAEIAEAQPASASTFMEGTSSAYAAPTVGEGPLEKPLPEQPVGRPAQQTGIPTQQPEPPYSTQPTVVGAEIARPASETVPTPGPAAEAGQPREAKGKPEAPTAFEREEETPAPEKKPPMEEKEKHFFWE